MRSWDDFPNRSDRINQKHSHCKKCLAAYTKKYTAKHKKHRTEYNRQYKLKHKERLSEYNKKYLSKYYRKNKSKLLAKARVYVRRRRRNDPKVRMIHNLRRRLHHAISGLSRSQRTLDLLGCTIVELQKHLKSSFVRGMTWKNYGKVWHIDHIRPLSSFDLLLEKEIKKSFHYKNLQPLFASDNLRKSNKY